MAEQDDFWNSLPKRPDWVPTIRNKVEGVSLNGSRENTRKTITYWVCGVSAFFLLLYALTAVCVNYFHPEAIGAVLTLENTIKTFLMPTVTLCLGFYFGAERQ